MNKKQISFTDDQVMLIDRLARRAGVSFAEVVRQCVDRCQSDLIDAYEAIPEHGQYILDKARGKK
jgi:hypothetical protein